MNALFPLLAATTLAAVFAASAADGISAATDKEAFLLSKLRGTPSEHEAPRDILVNHPDYVVFVPKQPRKWE